MAEVAYCSEIARIAVRKASNATCCVIHGHVESVPPVTNDQNRIGNCHTGDRLGRSAALNMVITETGAATAVAKALPELPGKLTGSSIRAPPPDVSLAILNLSLATGPTKDAVHNFLRELSLRSALPRLIDYADSPHVVSPALLGPRPPRLLHGLARHDGHFLGIHKR